MFFSASLPITIFTTELTTVEAYLFGKYTLQLFLFLLAGEVQSTVNYQ